MRVAVWPADEQGCGNYRLIFPAKALAAQGADVVIDKTGPIIQWSRDWSKLKHTPPWTHVVGFQQPYEADVVVMQRPAHQRMVELIPHLRAQGTRVIVDVDDLFDQIPRTSIVWSDYQKGGRFPAVNHSTTDEACKLADVVTCTTPLLQKRYGYGKGVVLPNLVPESYLSIDTFHWRNLIGWGGIVGTHAGDLSATEGAIEQSMRGRDDWQFLSVGPESGVREALKLSQPIEATGFVAFESWAPSLAELDLGIVPLASNLFNEAKSALKASEMASVGVPVVMSPTPDNRRLHALGVGLLAESRGQWARTIGRLMGSPEERADLAGRGREAMATQTYEAHCDRWSQAWQHPAKEIAA